MEEKKDKSNFRFLWSLVMVLVYLAMGYVLAFTPLFASIDNTIRFIMAGLFAVYGLFRGYRLLRSGK